jgi:hypothetical protein
MAKSAAGPDTLSCDYEFMLPYWCMVETILDGAEAMRCAGVKYLPKFENESVAQYEIRREVAKFTNIYGDIAANLASKPFSEETTLGQDAGEAYQRLAEDIDGRGNSLHVFAENTFYHGLNNAIDWILVDYTKAAPNPDGAPLSLAQEKAQGLRPYWVHIPAKRMLAVYSDVIAGTEIITHARMREDTVRRSGFEEIATKRIRVFDRAPIFEVGPNGQLTDRVIDYAPATFEIWEQQAVGGRDGLQWTSVSGGTLTIGVIPLVPYITGRRKGASWRFTPPLQGVADLQIEHYQQENGLKYARDMTAFPMLAGNGVTPPMDAAGKPERVPVGPRTVLFAPPSGDAGQHGEWTFIEPSASSLTFLAAQVDVTEKQMRELGRQPLVAAQMTVVQAGMNAQKANSAIQAWALRLKDALEQAFMLTARWLNDSAPPEVTVFTDFEVGMNDDKDVDALNTARGAGDLSRETYWEEFKRRNILSANFDPDAEQERLDEEGQAADSEAELAASLTPPTKTPANAA